MSAEARLEEVLRSMWIERHEDVMGQVAVVEEAVTELSPAH
ncbi:MAG TPA: hypothetical protein VFZ89_16125 [Solirubrobacteraceae bacterium]